MDILKHQQITTVLPIRDMSTGLAKKFHFTGGNKSMDVKGIVYIFDSITENNITNYDRLYTDLIREANSVFYVKISFGGNTAACGPVLRSLDAKSLPEDVANLAMMS